MTAPSHTDPVRVDAIMPAASFSSTMTPSAPPVVATPPRWDLDFEALARDLRPLGSPTRVRLLNLLTVPRYLEEIASFLKINRYAAKKHMDQLVKTGLVTKTPTQRTQGLVVEYRVVPQKLFELFDSMRALGTLRPALGGTEVARVDRTKFSAPAKARTAADALTPRFVVVYGVDLGTIVPLESTKGASAWTIGRDAGCDMRLEADPFASARHARIERQGGAYTLTDLYSTNGTFLEWERLAPGQPRPLDNGHVVGVGKTLLLFRNR